MKITAPDHSRDPAQTTQRVRVGMIGLAAVLLLIGLAAAMYATVTHERQVAVVGAANQNVVAGLVAGNSTTAATAAREPLAELGVAPSATLDSGNAAQIDNRTAQAPR